MAKSGLCCRRLQFASCSNWGCHVSNCDIFKKMVLFWSALLWLADGVNITEGCFSRVLSCNYKEVLVFSTKCPTLIFFSCCFVCFCYSNLFFFILLNSFFNPFFIRTPSFPLEFISSIIHLSTVLKDRWGTVTLKSVSEQKICSR